MTSQVVYELVAKNIDLIKWYLIQYEKTRIKQRKQYFLQHIKKVTNDCLYLINSIGDK